MEKLVACVNQLIEKAAKAEKSDDALKFSQAACNAANALAQIKLNVTPYDEPRGLGCTAVVMPRRYLCERCGGTGIQPSGCWNGTAYASEAGQCELCSGEGLLGVIAEPLETRCCFHDERRQRCQLRDLHEGECLFEA